jgi:hypothetical protein
MRGPRYNAGVCAPRRRRWFDFQLRGLQRENGRMDEGPYTSPNPFACTRSRGTISYRFVLSVAILVTIALWIDSHFNWTKLVICRPTRAIVYEQLLGQVEFRFEQLVRGTWSPSSDAYHQRTTSDSELAWESYDWQFAGVALAWNHQDPLNGWHTWYKFSLPYWLIVVSLIALSGWRHFAKPLNWSSTFRLRTLFVLIAMLSVPLAWIGYSLEWIRQRHQFLTPNSATYPMTWPLNYKPPPLLLQPFGEEGIDEIILPTKPASPEQIEEARRLFPEAKIGKD